MNEITVTSEMTFREFSACQDKLQCRKRSRAVLWALFTLGASFLASSAALTWGTPASILAGLAFAIFIFSMFLSGQITGTQRRKVYQKYSESDAIYSFTDERILAASRYVQRWIAWPAIDRVIETETAFLLVVGVSYICVLKRNIPPNRLDEFMQLLRTRHRLEQQ